MSESADGERVASNLLTPIRHGTRIRFGDSEEYKLVSSIFREKKNRRNTKYIALSHTHTLTHTLSLLSHTLHTLYLSLPPCLSLSFSRFSYIYLALLRSVTREILVLPPHTDIYDIHTCMHTYLLSYIHTHIDVAIDIYMC
jgi:hypothetical protein